jgi:hypothetical protein
MLSKRIENSNNSKISTTITSNNSIVKDNQVDTIIDNNNVAVAATSRVTANKSSTSSSNNRRCSSSASEIACSELDTVDAAHACYVSPSSSVAATETLTNIDADECDSTFYNENEPTNLTQKTSTMNLTETNSIPTKNSSTHRSTDLLSKFIFSSNRKKSVRFIEKSICLTTGNTSLNESDRHSSDNLKDQEADAATLASDVNDLSGISMKIGNINLRSPSSTKNQTVSPATKNEHVRNTSRSSSSSSNKMSNNNNDTNKSSSRLINHTRSLSTNKEIKNAEMLVNSHTENVYDTSAKENSNLQEKNGRNRRPSPLYSLNHHNNNNNSLLRNLVKFFRLKNKTSTSSSSSPSNERRRILEYSLSPNSISSDSSQLNYCC